MNFWKLLIIQICVLIMEAWKKYDISKLINYVETEKHEKAYPICSNAKDDYKYIKERISITIGEKIEPVLQLIDNVEHMRILNKEKTMETISLFYRYIKPFLEEEERTSSREAKKIEVNPTAPDSEESPTKQGLVSTNYTKKTIERGTAGLVLAFRNLFSEGAWQAAFKYIHTMTNSEKLSEECLYRIVKKAFEINKQEAELQLSTADECAKHIVMKGKSDPKDLTQAVGITHANDLLRAYRYIHAELATERLQKVLLEEARKLLSETYNLEITENTGLETFIRECAEITWLMCVEDPPINILDGDDLDRFDIKNYETLTGKPYDAVVMPALQQAGFAKPLALGILWSK